MGSQSLVVSLHIYQHPGFLLIRSMRVRVQADGLIEGVERFLKPPDLMKNLPFLGVSAGTGIIELNGSVAGIEGFLVRFQIRERLRSLFVPLRTLRTGLQRMM